ncbi:pyridoxal phosphate phosphatase PHOSPHO2 [Drosophila subpulchrella]|uniref:pyridoxal phosphate phosphatase PHOSPHO2 n=1 Tax=Drosophila subpulchrella TaxID=1486046 RepID=UPI0018A1B12D|nr:pyridoxal phosphate phosphatase PHOSPHO2 [Drosophila subpulchrella]
MSEMVDQGTGDCEPKATGGGSVRNVTFVGPADMGITLLILMCFVDPYMKYVLYVNECVLILKSKSFVFHTKMFAISRSFRLSIYLSGFRRSLSQSSPPGPRILAAIDFDKTIVQEDSYLAVSQLLPIGQSKELQDQIPKCGWLGFIGRVLQVLHSEHKVDSASVGMRVRRLQAVPGMLRVVRLLARNPAVDLCIVSDANSFFIGEWLREYGLECLFTGVFTNPACVQASGEILVLPYQEQADCELCPSNLCKGSVLEELICSGRYRRVVYVGDSCNDLCAMKRLREEDVACIRRGYELHGKLAAHGPELVCSVLAWRDGHELEQLLVPKVVD